ncbi:MAG TPA: hypothetical protein VFS12_17195, partial [Terriglobia bacterium]|nr:hypothetical protein [Terriglobia bacterium]
PSTVRLPSPQRGEGFGGEGQARSIDFRTAREEPCPMREDRHTLPQRENPPHPRPLSRVGARGAEIVTWAG